MDEHRTQHAETHWPCVGACAVTGGACPPARRTLFDRAVGWLINLMARRSR